jgi:hypothetical protein
MIQQQFKVQLTQQVQQVAQYFFRQAFTELLHHWICHTMH